MINALKLLLFASIIGTIFSCSEIKSKTVIDRERFPDILNIKNIPLESVDWASFCFFDKGAWFGFALPPDTLLEHYGSFIGPFLATEGRWSAPYIAKINLYDVGAKRKIELENANKYVLHYYPGLLFQQYELKGIVLTLKLFYINSDAAVVSAQIYNQGKQDRKIAVNWTGITFPSSAVLQQGNGIQGIAVKSIADTTTLYIIPDCETTELSADSVSYMMKLKPKEISGGETVTTTLIISFHHKVDEADVAVEFEANKDRWNSYLDKILTTHNSWGSVSGYQKIAVKSLETLISNWKSPYGALLHDGLFPSYAVSDFNGFWAWDSWKHAVALAIFDPRLAKNQIRAMYDYQNSDGMIADCIYADSTENNWLNTKPPLSGWAIWEVYKKTGDKEFLVEMLPKLVKYHNWWYSKRDFNHNLLCGYGSSDQSLVAAKWESGMDNAIRFDSSSMIKIDDNNWAFNQESVDLNSYLYSEKRYIAKMFEATGDKNRGHKWRKEAEKIRKLINEKMFDPETNFYYDINAETGDFVKVMGAEGWAPLFNKVATYDIARKVINVMLKSDKFGSYIPFPVVSVSEKEFSTGYWRGPVWLDQTYFAIMSLYNYGYEEEARKYTLQVFDRLEGLKSNAPVRENYWPVDGKGMRVNHFSWSAAHLLLLYHAGME